MKQKLYFGPEGVFYDDANDCIFVLKATDGFIGKTRRFKRFNGLFDVYYKAARPIARNVGVACWPEGEIIRLDDVPEGFEK